MVSITIQVTEEEKDLLESYAKLHNESISNILMKAFLEKVEDELDLEMIKAYEKEKNSETFTAFEKLVEE